MNAFKAIFLVLLIAYFNTTLQAQISASVDALEIAYKDCLKNKPDSNACFKDFWYQTDSIEKLLVNKISNQLASNDKTTFIQEEVSWAKKKGELFKKMDETFKYNLQEGIWTKDMIRVNYQQKGEYILKRVRVLLKQLKE